MVTYYLESNAKKPLQVKDFVILEQTMYVLAKGFGLKILNIIALKEGSDISTKTMTGAQLADSNFLLKIPQCFQFANEFMHPHLKKIDYKFNYLTNRGFVGMLVDSDILVPEFFIELVVIDEFNPVINKIFYSPQPILADTFVTDDHFSYIMDKKQLSMIVIRRCLLS